MLNQLYCFVTTNIREKNFLGSGFIFVLAFECYEVEMDFSEAYTDRCSTVGHAARRGDIKSLRRLIKNGSSVDVADNRGWMPIHEAAFSDAAQCLQLLIHSAPSRDYVKSKTFEGQSALHLAAKRGSVQCSKILLRAGADPNDLTNDETTPLFLAVENGCEAVVKLLLKYKANVNGPHSCSGWNPLHQASLMEHTDLIQLLLENGVDKECRDDFGITPLFIAAQYGKYESLRLLSSHGADVNCQAKDKATPLFIAAQEGHEKCAELLLSTGADPNLYCNDDGWQLPIHAAAQMGRSKILEMLILVTSRVCNTGKDQVSPVYSAVYGGHIQCLDMLLSGGFNPEAQECPLFGCKSPMSMTIQKGHSVMAPILLKYGFQLSSCYLQSCLEYNNFPLFRYFLSHDCPLPSGDELDAFKRSSKSHYKEWLPYLLLAGLDPRPLLDAAWIGSVNNDIVNLTLEFTNWKRLCADMEQLLSTHAEHFTWIPHKHFASLPSLMHLCRLKVRSLLKTEHLRSNKYISRLPLPVCLQDYLQYSDVLHLYGIARKDDSHEDNLENISQASD
ncbi:ankyrin repeat and SOCS box protein 3 isoform X2 [Hyla sarda]|uniref:ankyrin repeat and SOCS box protein 3 isoform X2 n=1 Tax=Hyla sarda TaxID=327740 RepID=UPI0024C3AD2A|nr:ankyrin repeat and SOCS box protein 3 isoform X2 [Hyla sarda]